MKISQILFTLCAASTPLCHSMQLALKTNNGIKQIPKIALQKEFYATSTKQKKQPKDNCNNCCIVKGKEQIKDLIAQFSNKLQSCFSTYSSKFLTGNETRDKLSSANVIASIMNVSFAIGASDPSFLLPVSINVFLMGAFKSKPIRPQQNRPPLVKDIEAYVKEMTRNGRIDDIEKILCDLDRLNSGPRYLPIQNIRIPSGLEYFDTKKIAQLNETKATLGNELCKRMSQKYNDANIQESIAYMEKTGEFGIGECDNAVPLECLLTGAALMATSMVMFLDVGGLPLGISTLVNSFLLLSASRVALLDNSAAKNLTCINVRIAKDLIKTYKEHLATEKNTVSTTSTKESKKKKNTE